MLSAVKSFRKTIIGGSLVNDDNLCKICFSEELTDETCDTIREPTPILPTTENFQKLPG